MIESKGWNWEIVKNEKEKIWKTPSVESYYLVSRWKSQNKKNFLDLGCGLGRHSILFGKNEFCVSCFDISKEAINRTKEWAEKEYLKFDYKVGDMIKLPYKSEQFDCIYFAIEACKLQYLNFVHLFGLLRCLQTYHLAYIRLRHIHYPEHQ